MPATCRRRCPKHHYLNICRRFSPIYLIGSRPGKLTWAQLCRYIGDKYLYEPGLISWQLSPGQIRMTFDKNRPRSAFFSVLRWHFCERWWEFSLIALFYWYISLQDCDPFSMRCKSCGKQNVYDLSSNNKVICFITKVLFAATMYTFMKHFSKKVLGMDEFFTENISNLLGIV